MATFKIKLSKNDDQSVVTIKQDDAVDLSAATSIVASLYSDDISTADNTYTFSAQDITDFLAGGVNVAVSDLIGASPDDDFYTVSLNVNSGAFVSSLAGVAITTEAEGKVYNKQVKVNVYDPDNRLEEKLHTCHILFQSMNAIENQDSSLQKRVDFTTRLATLKKILNYE